MAKAKARGHGEGVISAPAPKRRRVVPRGTGSFSQRGADAR